MIITRESLIADGINPSRVRWRVNGKPVIRVILADDELKIVQTENNKVITEIDAQSAEARHDDGRLIIKW